jgi:predicted DNA-binding transcriptional regulator AlpA
MKESAMSTIEGLDGVFETPAFMTVEQLAKLIQKSVRSVWRMRSAGQVPKPVKLGGGVRWRVRDIEDWIDRGCPGPDDRQNARRR